MISRQQGASVALIVALVIASIFVMTATGIPWVRVRYNRPDLSATVEHTLSLWRSEITVTIPGRALQKAVIKYTELNGNSDDPYCRPDSSSQMKEGTVVRLLRTSAAMFVIGSLTCGASLALAVLLVLRKVPSIWPVLGAIVGAAVATLLGIIFFAVVYNACDKDMCSELEATARSAPAVNLGLSCNGSDGFGVAGTGLVVLSLVSVPLLFLYWHFDEPELEGATQADAEVHPGIVYGRPVNDEDVQRYQTQPTAERHDNVIVGVAKHQE